MDRAGGNSPNANHKNWWYNYDDETGGRAGRTRAKPICMRIDPNFRKKPRKRHDCAIYLKMAKKSFSNVGCCCGKT